MPPILEANDISIIKWYVDASFAVHPDMKSHTGRGNYDTGQRGYLRNFNQTKKTL